MDSISYTMTIRNLVFRRKDTHDDMIGIRFWIVFLLKYWRNKIIYIHLFFLWNTFHFIFYDNNIHHNIVHDFEILKNLKDKDAREKPLNEKKKNITKFNHIIFVWEIENLCNMRSFFFLYWVKFMSHKFLFSFFLKFFSLIKKIMFINVVELDI